MKIKTNTMNALFTMLFITLGVIALSGCADELKQEVGKECPVRFNVINAGNAKMATTRGIAPMSDIKVEELTSQKLAINSSEGFDGWIIETTEVWDKPQSNTSVATRANVVESIEKEFTALGYEGTRISTISQTPNFFYNTMTFPWGQLSFDAPSWSPKFPYARFYAIYPLVAYAGDKIKLSDINYAGTPYMDFDCPLDVTKQIDLMTACSGNVYYDAAAFKNNNEEPRTNMHFRHALTTINFVVGKNLDNDYIIDSIEISGAMSKGRYTLSNELSGVGAAWSQLSNPATFTLSGINASTSKPENTVIIGNNGDNQTFYMIPQKLDNVTICIHFTNGMEFNARLKGAWKSGKIKTYTINKGSDGMA